MAHICSKVKLTQLMRELQDKIVDQQHTAEGADLSCMDGRTNHSYAKGKLDAYADVMRDIKKIIEE